MRLPVQEPFTHFCNIDSLAMVTWGLEWSLGRGQRIVAGNGQACKGPYCQIGRAHV